MSLSFVSLLDLGSNLQKTTSIKLFSEFLYDYCMLNIQKLAADFLSNYVYLTVGKVGSSSDLITQKVVDVSHLDKRRHLIDILRSQSVNAAHGVVH